MKNAETLIPFFVAVIALLSYIAWVVRRLAKWSAWMRRLPKEHEWLMQNTRNHSKEIHRLANQVDANTRVIREIMERG